MYINTHPSKVMDCSLQYHPRKYNVLTSGYLFLSMPCFVRFNLFPKMAELILCFQLKICNRLLLGNTPPFHFFSSFIASCNSDSSLPCELRATISTYALKPFLPVFLACHPWSCSVLTCQSYRLARCSCSTESFIHVP